MTTKTASAGFPDDFGKIVAVIGALVAFGKLPKKWGVPVALIALLLAFEA